MCCWQRSRPERRRIAPSLIAVRDEHDPLMSDELFGPLLPVLSIPNLDAAIHTFRSMPAPSPFYLARHQPSEAGAAPTSSGGVCFNDGAADVVPDLRSGASAPAAEPTTKRSSAPFPAERSVLRRRSANFPQRYPPCASPDTFRRCWAEHPSQWPGGDWHQAEHLMVRPWNACRTLLTIPPMALSPLAAAASVTVKSGDPVRHRGSLRRLRQQPDARGGLRDSDFVQQVAAAGPEPSVLAQAATVRSGDTLTESLPYRVTERQLSC